jgi:outer membrane protein
MNSTRSVYVLPILYWLAIGTAQAEFVGLNIGASHWTPSISGSFNTGNDSSIDLVDDLSIDNPSESSMVLILEHPIPVLPNIRYQGFNLDTSGSATLESDINFNGQTFSSGNQVTSTFDLSHDDIVLYYQLLDNWVNLDMGLDFKRFDGEVSLSGITSTSVDVDETIPLFYLSARFDLPHSGFYVGADINTNFSTFGIGNSTAEDSTLKLGYESGNGLGVEGGIKYFSLELDDVNDLDTDLKYDGIYFNGYYNF